MTEQAQPSNLAQRLKASFDKHFEAPILAWEQFAALCDIVHFRKNEILKQAGDAEKYGYFILSGSGGVFLWKENHAVCLDLMYENDFFADYMSLITQQASPLETMALENSEMLRISRENISRLKETPMGGFLFLVSAEASFVDKQKQQIDLMLKTAEVRYAELIEERPDIIRQTSQKHIASFLGITTQSLSRIRKNLGRDD